MNDKRNCRVCDEIIFSFMDFGKMPIANGFLNKENFSEEYFFKMKTAFCDKCNSFQLIEQPEPKLMFNINYPFFSSLSKYMNIHFENFSNYIIENHLKNKSNSFVVEIGSNDGIMLKNFKQKGYRHLGVEPSENVAEISRKYKLIKYINDCYSNHVSVIICK